MAWRECKRCQKRLFFIEGKEPPLDGYCEACYEEMTGKCALCQGTGEIERAHLGVSECWKCEGTGDAIAPNGLNG
jgi:hypothetical protein